MKTETVSHEKSSVLRTLCNLICTEGHLSYSPEPMVYVDSECARPKCHKPMHLIEGAKAIPEKKVMRKKIKRY